MLHRLDDTCLLKRSDAEEILLILSRVGHGDLCNTLHGALQESYDGWVAVPYKASKYQLKGMTAYPISLSRWQYILELSPYK